MGLAARGTRKIGETVEVIDDAAELAQVKRQARQVQIRSFISALVLMALALLP